MWLGGADTVSVCLQCRPVSACMSGIGTVLSSSELSFTERRTLRCRCDHRVRQLKRSKTTCTL